MESKESIKSVLDHIISISKGKCSITDEKIANETDEDIRGVLIGLLYLFEDLELSKDDLDSANVALKKKLNLQSEELRVAEAERLRLLNNSMDLIGVLNVEGYFENTNRAFSKALGYSTEKILSTPWVKFVHPDDIEDTLSELTKLTLGEGALNFENRFLCLNGNYIWLSWNVFLDKKTEKFFVIGRDITKEKLVREELKKSNKNLTEINESLDAFSYRLTHDLRAPAINVSSMLQMLGTTIDIDSGSKAEAIFTHAKSSSRKLLETIEDFLELVKIEKAGKENSETCNLLGIIDYIKGQLKQTISDKKAAITLMFNNDSTLFMVKEDLKSILLNLISNSIKYCATNKAPEITISLKQKDKLNTLSISDNGMGIDLENQKEKVFKMFSRFHTDSTIDGTGIGLYLVKKLVDKNNGDISIQSEVEKGTTFTINFPVK